MTKYSCKCGKESKEVGKTKIIYVDGAWVSDVMCSCGKYMDSEPTEGMPNLIRTEPTLTKKRDNLWEGAKEKLVGERGINESFD